jgi:hypothetical protein
VFAGFGASAQFGIKPIVQEPLCHGDATGSISLVITGGVAPYTYNWCCGLPSTNSQSGLAAGSYSVTVVDNTLASTTYTITFSEPTPVSLNIGETNVSVHGGSDGHALLTTSGGTPDYTWNWSNGSTQESQYGLTAGVYSVTATDAFGCTATGSTTIYQPSSVLINPNLLPGHIGGMVQGHIHMGSVEQNGGRLEDGADLGTSGNSAPEMNGNEVTVYPNPTSDFISVRTGSNSAEITLTNSLGQTISRKMADSYETKFDVTTLGKGDYIVSIKTETGTVNKMVSVVR